MPPVFTTRTFAREASFLASALVLACVLACSACSSSNSDSIADAGPADAADAADTAVPFTPLDAAPPPQVDAGTHCDQLKADVGKFANLARACAPSSNSPQCSATTNGICCPITVSTANVQAVNDLDQAVSTWK